MSSLAPAQLKGVEIDLPPRLPTSLLARRPGIATAERAMAAANARTGVAKPAFLPLLTLKGAGVFEWNSLGNLLNWRT